MSDQIITSDLFVELSTDEQQLLCGGQFFPGFDRDDRDFDFDRRRRRGRFPHFCDHR